VTLTPDQRTDGGREPSAPAADSARSWRRPASWRIAGALGRERSKWSDRTRLARIQRTAPSASLQHAWLGWTRPFRWIGLRLYRDMRWWVSIFVTAVQRFDQHDSEMRAAAIAYYALISLFPLILLLIVGVSYVLETEAAQARVLELVGTYIPTSIDIVRESIRQILGARGAISAVALITFTWSAMAVFSTIERAMNRIWDVTVLRPYWRGKLMALLGIIGIGTLTVLSVSTTAAVTYVKDVILPFVASHTEVDIGPWAVLVVLLPYLTSVLLFMLAYRIFPYSNLGWRDVWPGALLAGLVWEQAKRLFALYLTGFNRTSFVYGSVGAIIATLIWFYLTAMILLIGAEISSAYTHKRRAIRFQP
jgi:membrane protein